MLNNGNCPKCGNLLLVDDKDIFCLTCGFRDSFVRGAVNETEWENQLYEYKLIEYIMFNKNLCLK